MEIKKRLIGSIDFENESIIITDPCYLKQYNGDENWENWRDFFK